jgi:hypothetical protein
MEIHVLNGDALASKFPLPGEVVVCRECMVVGPKSAPSIDGLWKQRAEFIADSFETSHQDYYQQVTQQFQKLLDADPSSPMNLWFEHDLFCQANLWFIVYFLGKANIQNTLSIVLPNDPPDSWNGFGRLGPNELTECFTNRVLLQNDDRLLAEKLWDAFANDDLTTLAQLSKFQTAIFPRLKEVCKAHIDRFANGGLGRPHVRLREISQSGEKNFTSIFQQFAATEGVYGFGDVQVKKMLQEI